MNRSENDVITTDEISARIHLLNNHSLRPSQSFSFFNKSTGPYLLFVAPALYVLNYFILINIFDILMKYNYNKFFTNKNVYHSV